MMQSCHISDRTKRVIGFLLSAVCLVKLAGLASVFVCNGQYFYLVDDDSLITLRVANNIAHGMGPYFNACEHVAANTSLIWPFVLSLAFHHYPLSPAVLFLSEASLVLTAIIFALIAFGAASARSAVLGLATLVLLPSFVHYAPTAWEHIPQTIFTTAAMLLLLGRPRRLEPWSLQLSLVLLGLAFLLRPDTLPLMVVPALALVIRLIRKVQISSLGALCSSAICVVGYLALHRHMYGGFLPNTYYLKVALGLHSIRVGIAYTIGTATHSVGPLFVCALILFWLSNRRQWQAREQLVLLAISLQCVYVILVGGDYFEYGRFYLLILPVAVMLFWEKADEQFFCNAGKKNPLVITAIALICVGILASTFYLQREITLGSVLNWEHGQFIPPQDQRIGQLELAPIIREHIRPEDGRIGLFYLGALGYYLPEYTMADFLGKADPVIAHGPVKWGPVAHNKWDIDFSLRNRNIAAIPFAPIPEAKARLELDNHADYAFNCALQLSPYLKQHYLWLSPEQLGVSGPEGLYVRNDLVSRFQIEHRLTKVPAFHDDRGE